MDFLGWSGNPTQTGTSPVHTVSISVLLFELIDLSRRKACLLPEYFNLRNLTLAVLACTVSLAPLGSSRPHPNDSFLVITSDGMELCIIDQSWLDDLEQMQESGCGNTSECSSKMPSSATTCAASPCGASPCAEPVPVCPKTRTCSVRVQLNSQPLLAHVFALAENTRHLLGVMVPGDETTEYRNIKPPVPPPQYC
jgi:hypothetical protein